MENNNKAVGKKVKKGTRKLKKTQAQLVQSAKIAAVGQLGAIVAHELNNPLGGILGYAQYLLDKIKKPDFSSTDFKNCKKKLKYIEIEAQRCKKIVENLLLFSQKPVFHKKPLDIRSVLKNTLLTMEQQLSRYNIKAIYRFAPNLKKVLGDADQMQQVFTNIIINALHAMSEKKGTLTITAKNKNEHQIVISFSDTGCGISPANIDKIFEPFFTTKQNDRGTGLGLSISHEIIKKHQGYIEIKSQIGKGTTFTIFLVAFNKS